MTDQPKPSRLDVLKHAVHLVVDGIRQALPDLVGVLGFGLLTRGLWLWFGEPVALTVVGTALLGLAMFSAVRGAR